jgi:biopolymer transport protein TolQ
MLLLLAVSFMSWMFIFRKAMTIRSARAQTELFEREFWSGNDINSLYQGSVNNRHTIGSLERIFEAGYREFTKLRAQRGTDASTMVDGARRAMRATYQREIPPRAIFLSPRPGRAPTWACSAPSGASCMPSAARPTQQATRRRSPPASPGLIATAIGLFARSPR